MQVCWFWRLPYNRRL